MKAAMTEKRAREYLLNAIDRACIARGEAQWMNGYRCGRSNRTSYYTEEQDRDLHEKEMQRFTVCGITEDAMKRWIATFARVVRQSRRTAPGTRAKAKRLVNARKT